MVSELIAESIVEAQACFPSNSNKELACSLLDFFVQPKIPINHGLTATELPNRTENLSNKMAPRKWKFDMNKPVGQSVVASGAILPPVGYDVNLDLVSFSFSFFLLSTHKN